MATFTLVENDIILSIHQNIQIALFTPKGSDPLRPEFGSDLLSIIDKPITTITQGRVQAILAEVMEWEPRAKLESVTVTRDAPNAKAKITYTIYIPELDQYSTGTITI